VLPRVFDQVHSIHLVHSHSSFMFKSVIRPTTNALKSTTRTFSNSAIRMGVTVGEYALVQELQAGRISGLSSLSVTRGTWDCG
jgi:hypothetical protein